MASSPESASTWNSCDRSPPIVAGVGLDGTERQPAALEDARVGVVHHLVLAARVGRVDVEGVGILHDELAPAHQPEARTQLVAELHLDLVEGLRQVAVRAHLATHQVGHHLLVRRPEAEVALVAVLQAQQRLAVLVPAPALLPQLRGDDGRHEDLLRAGPVHLASRDRLDAAHDAQAERQEVVDAARDLADHPGAHEELVAHDLRVGRVVPQRRDQETGQPRHLAAAAARCSPRHWSASPPWLQAAPDAIAMATKMTSPISSSLHPACAALLVWASMHQGHCVMWEMPRAISSLVFDGDRAGRERLLIELEPRAIRVGRQLAHAAEYGLRVDTVERHPALLVPPLTPPAARCAAGAARLLLLVGVRRVQ